jgi:hypothetical protein
VSKEDPSNKLLDLETQLNWLREIGSGGNWRCWRALNRPKRVEVASFDTGSTRFE